MSKNGPAPWLTSTTAVGLASWTSNMVTGYDVVQLAAFSPSGTIGVGIPAFAELDPEGEDIAGVVQPDDFASSAQDP